MHQWTALLTILFPLVTSLLTSETSDSQTIQRSIRAFPYSVSLNKMIGPARRHNLYAIGDDELSAIIDQINNDGLLRRRRDGRPLKRYACRFKFCRIFDA
ncbi:hypothetical protein Q1695_005296 [Nippostrongylus brasiliensis]|nr:hypothetical protein Q1695_005296 [Nippostrongylus brasiliensis]